jgi:hypothetical protein
VREDNGPGVLQFVGSREMRLEAGAGGERCIRQTFDALNGHSALRTDQKGRTRTTEGIEEPPARSYVRKHLANQARRERFLVLHPSVDRLGALTRSD